MGQVFPSPRSSMLGTNTQPKDKFQKEFKLSQAELLQQSSPIGAVGTPSYNGNEQLTSIVWNNNSGHLVRTDTFSYTTLGLQEVVQEVRQLPTLETLTIVTMFDEDGTFLGRSSEFGGA